MRKSSSAQIISLPFNPNQCPSGESRIDRLPLRRHSAHHLQTLPSAPSQPSARSPLDTLRRQNADLQRQNQQLKRELQSLRSQSGSTSTKREKVACYREMIRDKLTSRVKQSRNTECETRLFSSKEVSLESTLTLSDYYDQYKVSHKVPALSDLNDIADKFFKDYCDGYAKLKCLFDCLHPTRASPAHQHLGSLLELYRVPLLYQKSPESLLRQLSKGKSRQESRKGREDSRRGKEEVCPQQMSPAETAARIEHLLGKVCRSGPMLRLLKTNETVLRFVQKVSSDKL